MFPSLRSFRLTPYSSLLTLLFVSAVHAGWFQQSSGTTANLHSVCFINAQTGWVAGDTSCIFRTTDGGTHWEPCLVASGITYSPSIRFWDASLGFVITNSNPWGLYKTTDGGLTWRNIPQSFQDYPRQIAFVTPLKGWLVGYILASGDGADGTVYQTTDGGESWVLRIHAPYAFRDVAFADSLFGWVTADNHAVFLNSQGCVEQTTDGGSTWQAVDSNAAAYRTLCFAGPDFAWRSWRTFIPPSIDIWGVAKTTDRGGHWAPIYQGAGDWIPPLAVADSLKGWILPGADSVIATRDGGASWSKQVPPGSNKTDIWFADSLNGWIVGGNGLILHTTDGGSGVWEEPSRLTPWASRLTASPNPFASFTTVPGHEAERFALYDISGRKVGTYHGDRIGEGLPAGVYFLSLKGKDAKPLRIIKLR
jgi:photosystem II stability/assembly factor-like uncharacterized protein